IIDDNIRMKPKAPILRLDLPLLTGLLVLIGVGMFILFSAGDQSLALLSKQAMRFAIGFIVLIALAQVPPHKYLQWAPWCFLLSILLLLSLLVIGHVGKGAESWINLGIIRLQPSELLKITLPLLLAWYLHDK